MIFKKYRIDELFDCLLASGDIQAKKASNGSIPLISAGNAENQGIVKYINPEDNEIFESGTFTVDMFGLCIYRPEPYCSVSHGRINILVPNGWEANEQIGLYICAVINKTFSGKFSYERMCSKHLLEPMKISLPSTPSGSPDWTYMEKYIKEIEKKYIEKEKLKADVTLKSYLDVTCFDDCRLTDEEEKVLLEDKEMGEFALSDIFEIRSSKKSFNAVSNEIISSGGHPYVVRTSQNNGMRGRINAGDEFLNPPYTFSFAQDTAQVFWQTEAYFTGNNVKVLVPKAEISENVALYFLTAMRKVLVRFSWGMSYKRSVIENIRIVLPITSENTPDYAFMDTYISAIKKNTISEVFKYTKNRLKELEKITA